MISDQISFSSFSLNTSPCSGSVPLQFFKTMGREFYVSELSCLKKVETE